MITHRMSLHGSNENGNNALKKNVAFRSGLIHEEETEHRNLIAVPEKALGNFNGSKNSPCRLKGLVVLIKFSSHGSRVLPLGTDYDILFNNNGPTTNNIAPTGSVADVYLENSYDTFVLESVISDWVTLSKTEAQAVDGDLDLNKPGTKATWSEALTLAKQQFGNSFKQFDGDGDSTFDSLVMMHSGTASETGGIDVKTNGDYKTRIWSHATFSEWYKDDDIKVGRLYVASGLWDIAPPRGKFTKFDIARIAVIAHECSHFLGLPDLYDTTGGTDVETYDLLGK
jgi:M6 family metalloprotease-like protein